MLTVLKDLFRPAARQPEFEVNDPRHPVNAGWQRSDLPDGRRRVRFRISVSDSSKAGLSHPHEYGVLDIRRDYHIL